MYHRLHVKAKIITLLEESIGKKQNKNIYDFAVGKGQGGKSTNNKKKKVKHWILSKEKNLPFKINS